MVQIITDSSSLYRVEEARELGFEAVPLCVAIGDLEGRDLQVDMKDFLWSASLYGAEGTAVEGGY